MWGYIGEGSTRPVIRASIQTGNDHRTLVTGVDTGLNRYIDDWPGTPLYISQR